MLIQVDVTTPTGDLLSLPLDDVSDGLILKEIEGLDPVNATLVSSSFAQQDGAQYQSSRRETRNIVIHMELDPVLDGTVRDLRKRLYKYFMPKSQVSLRFYMEDLEADIAGRVENMPTAMFSAEPAVDISIICFDPDFIDATPVEVAGSTTSDIDEILLEYGDEGQVDTGMLFTVNINRSVSDLTIYHRTPANDLRIMEFSAALVSGDVLKISTVTGDKYATLTHLGSDSSVLYAVSPQSAWTALEPGDNYIRIYAEGAAIPYTIDYITRYGGL